MNGTMNKEYYKSAFSAVCPSDEAIERIFSMTEKKKRIFRHKGLIIVAAVIAALICGTFTVNAATDGALFHGIRVILNGKEVNPEEHNIKCKAYVDEEGRKMTAVGMYDSDGKLQGMVLTGNIDFDPSQWDPDSLLKGDIDSLSEDEGADVDITINDIPIAGGGHSTNFHINYN